MPSHIITLAAPPLAATAERVPPPPIPACRQWAAAYDGAQGPLLDLTQAVPGYAPHPGLLHRLGEAAADPTLAGYGPLEGEAALRDAFAQETRALHGGDAVLDDVRITAGANQGFNLVMTVITAPGDAVLLPTPWFFNHQMALALRGVEAIPLPCCAQDGFLPDPDRAAALITPRTRAIVLVTPNNPTGAVLPPALIARFAELCRTQRLWLVLDETYRDFGPAVPVARQSAANAARRGEAGQRANGAAPGPHALFRHDGWRSFVVQIYSFSKAYCIPGHRLGAVVAGPALRAALLKAVDNIQICPPRPPQAALTWGIPALRTWRRGNARLMARRLDAFADAMLHAAHWRIEARGAYFAWIRVPDRWPDSSRVAERLAREFGLVTLPGAFFGPGGQRHLRVAVANVADEALAEVPRRLTAFEAAH